jgi:hypothetical protein
LLAGYVCTASIFENSAKGTFLKEVTDPIEKGKKGFVDYFACNFGK